jgi:hypothetical protein
MRNINQFPI